MSMKIATFKCDSKSFKIKDEFKMAEFDSEDASKKMFGPLSFEESNFEECSPNLTQECLLCNSKFVLKSETECFLKHIFEVHNLVIEDFQSIERLDKYITYWKSRFEVSALENIIPSVKIEGTNQYYFILSILLAEDKQIRHKIRLECALEQQEFERTITDFKRCCLFCKLQFDGKYAEYVNHLSSQHNLQLGKPENLVYISKFFNVIEEKLASLKCIYCEKTFTDRNVLKEHMRKKLHKRINPANHFYDQFYIINYLEADRSWQHFQKEDDNLPITLDNDSDHEWSDWNEKDQEIVCLFCEYKDLSLANICDHMRGNHTFDFQDILKTMDFYQKVKLVNYIRRQMHICHCIKCDQSFETKETLMDHLKEEKHYAIPETKVFDQPEYYFPTYENDTLLYYLEEINETEVIE